MHHCVALYCMCDLKGIALQADTLAGCYTTPALLVGVCSKDDCCGKEDKMGLHLKELPDGSCVPTCSLEDLAKIRAASRLFMRGSA